MAFGALVRLVLERFGPLNSGLSYELEVPGAVAFPGLHIPTRRESPKIDILIRKSGRNIGIISTKWSFRHDRVDDLTTECRAYKAAASYTDTRIFYYVATNEFDPARTEKLICDPCVNGLVHVHKELVTVAAQLNGRMAQMHDLSDLVGLSHQW